MHFSFDLVFTNKVPTDAYREAGRPEATYLIERVIDLVAREVGEDPTDVRKLNFIQPDQFPYKSAAGAVYDTGDYEPALDKAMKMIGYHELRAEQAQKRAGVTKSCWALASLRTLRSAASVPRAPRRLVCNEMRARAHRAERHGDGLYRFVPAWTG